MILKVNDTKKFNIAMNLSIDYEAEEITIHIKHWDKQNGTICGYDYIQHRNFPLHSQSLKNWKITIRRKIK